MLMDIRYVRERTRIQENHRRNKYRLPLYRNTRSIRNLNRIDLAEQSWVDGCVAVLARHNHKRVIVETFGFQFVDNGSEGGVHKVYHFEYRRGKWKASRVLVPVRLLGDVD